MVVACAAPRSREWVGEAVSARTHFALGRGQADAGLAPGVELGDGLSANEAVALALWLSPVLQAELTQLEAALATLDEANRPANPRLNNFLFPLDLRQLAVVLFIPLESLWQMPSRISAATFELESTAETVVQLALDLERSVRNAHADAVLAHARVEVLKEAAHIWGTSVTLAEGRARGGDIAPADADQIRAEQVLALDVVQRSEKEAVMATERLRILLGAPVEVLPSLTTLERITDSPALETLQQLALTNRPDVAGASFALNAAAARADWERSKVFSIFLSVDAQAPVRSWTPQVAPGLQAELPIFSQNQGGIGRAEANIERARHRYAATRLVVMQEVTLAKTSLDRAQQSAIASQRIVELVQRTREAAAQTFESGADSYLVVVDALRRVTDAKLRALETEAECRRSEAELFRAVGGRALFEKTL